MNLSNFQYSQNLHSKIKKYEIRTLNDESQQNYMNRDSYVHKFLRSLDHERINGIFDHSQNPKPKSYNVESDETANTESNKNDNEYSNTPAPNEENM